MNPALREDLRLLILVALAASKTMGVRAETLLVHLTGDVRGLEAEDLDVELAYLADKGFAKIKHKALSPENKRWGITADGRDFLALEGLS